MFSSKNYIEKPIHLVSINSFGKLVLHYDAISQLKTLKSPLSILSIAGPYRTGKSFLLNSIISNTQNLTHPNTNAPSFEVGHTTNQTTHGLWIWSKPLLAYDQKNQITNVIVMDSQGYASSQSTHDKRLITLAILLSTCFLFNSKGAIDKDSLFDLQFVIEVARMIGQKEEIKASQENMKGKCDFHWILRDFQLQLVNELGHKITPNEYMQNCFLQAQSHVNQKTIQTLKQYFPHRTCHTLCHPSTDIEAEQRPEFISQIIGLKQSILKKNMKSFNMTGEAFVELLQSYIDAMNEGQQINSVFQEGYDCRVRMDCLEKLNSKLKRLEDQNENQIDLKLLNIKSQIKQYYKQRMCSQRQISVLNNQVEERIIEYQQDHNSSKGLHSTSVKCVEKEISYKNVPIIIPKSINNYNAGSNNAGHRNIRVSIQCSQNEDRSFLGEEQINEDSVKNHHHHSLSTQNNVRVSKLVVERKSVQKQKVSPQVKMLTNKIQKLQVTLHRTQLQLSTAESQLANQKQQNQLLRKSLNEKEDELMEMIQKCTSQEKKHLLQCQQSEEQKKNMQKILKLLQSQIHKQSLLYEEKIQFLQNELKFGDEARMNEFLVEKNKYKQKIRQLSQEIDEMTKKHKEETQQVRGIFNQQIQKVRAKSHWHMQENDQETEGKDIFAQLSEKVKQNQLLHKQVEQLKISNQKLMEEQQALEFKSLQREQSLKQELQQQAKRSLVNEEQLKTLYETKLMAKESQMSQLETRIKSLNEIAINENQKLIKNLKEMESNFSEEKQDLFIMNNQLRNGCLQALQRVSGLKDQIQLKEKRCQQLENDKAMLIKKITEQKQEHEREIKRQKQNQKNLRSKMNQQLQEKQQSIHQLQCKLLHQSHELQQTKQHWAQLQLELQMQKQTNQHLTEELQEVNDKLRQVEYNFKSISEDLIFKQQQLIDSNQQQNHVSQIQQKEIAQLKYLLEEAKQEKTALVESILQINKQLDSKYQNLQLIFNDKHEYDRKRHEQTAKDMKENEKKLFLTLEQTKLQNIQLTQRLKYTQKDLQSVNNQHKQTKDKLNQITEQLQQKTFDLQHLQRQSSKQQALSNQKITFLQHKITLLAQQTQSKSYQHQTKQQQLTQSINSLKSELKIQTQLYQQTLNSLQSTQRLYQQLQNKFNSLTKQAQDSQSQLMHQVEHLINRQSITQKDNSLMAENLLQLQEHLRQQQIQAQNHIRLYNHKLHQVKQQKSSIQNELAQLKQQYEQLLKQYNQLELNHSSDFTLWTKKFSKMQDNLKEAGWRHYQKTKNNRNQDIQKDCCKKVLS